MSKSKVLPRVVPLRLAFRVEGPFWNCYMAEMDTMGSAKLLGSIVMGVVEQHPDLKAEFMDLMKSVFEAAVKQVTGRGIDYWQEPYPAPESERSGNA